MAGLADHSTASTTSLSNIYILVALMEILWLKFGLSNLAYAEVCIFISIFIIVPLVLLGLATPSSSSWLLCLVEVSRIVFLLFIYLVDVSSA